MSSHANSDNGSAAVSHKNIAAGFDPNNPATWPLVLRTREVAAIVGLKPNTLSRKAHIGQFQPAPISTGRPYKWLRSDLLRVLQVA